MQTPSCIFYPPLPPHMDNPVPQAELLRSLGRLIRGLSALFWGLPAALIACAETAQADWLRPIGIVPALAAIGLLLYGLMQLGAFQKQERPWRAALDRAKLLGLVNFGLCPFLFWQNRVPAQPFFNAAVLLLGVSALLFLFNLNVVVKQLGAMLPDETLRHETRLFTALNRWLLVGLLLLSTAYVVFLHSSRWQRALGAYAGWLDRLGFWGFTFLFLLPLALTMAMLWKTKGVLLDSVFEAK
ncbi:MAG: hypothetical protein ABSE16_09300 [Verrucomicrobiota bacterium]